MNGRATGRLAAVLGRLGLLAGAPLPLFWAAGADADDIRATSAIESVLVFPSGADITRTGEIRLPAGEHRVIFRDLPQGLDPSSLRVRFGAETVIVGAVEAVQAYPEGGGPEAAQRLRDEEQAVRDQIQAVDDRIAVAELQLQFLQGQTNSIVKPDAGGGAASVAPADWAAALAAIEAGSQAARAEILAARQERRVLERRLEEVQIAADEIEDDLTLRTDVQVALTAEAAVTTALELTYQASSAGWGALYDARLDSEAATLTLERKIQVYQRSGEDWMRVRLSVSTAPPTDELVAPAVSSRYLSLYTPEPVGRGVMAEPAPAAAPMAAYPGEYDESEEIVVTGSRIMPVNTINANFASTYTVDGLVDVTSQYAPRTFSIGEEDIDVALVVRAAPRLSRDAFVTAKLTYEGGGPLPGGELRLYRDGAYLTEDYLNTLIPGQEFELGFGVDQQVIVTWVNEGGKESETGLIGRSTEIAEDHRFEMLNRHATPFTVELIDYRPIPQDDDIQLRVSPESTPPDEDEYEDRPGVLLWRKELAADETLAVRHAYSIVHPTNEILVGR